MINDPHLDDSGRREHRPAHGAQAAARGAGPRPAGGVRVPRPDHPAVHLGHGGLGRDRRADHREPDPPPARLGPVDARRVQEPHRRQRAGGGGRRPRGRGAARVRGCRRSAAPRRSCTPAATPTATSSCAAAETPPTTTPAGVAAALAELRAAGLPERVVVDASHDNSGKDPERQAAAAAEIAAQVAAGNGAIVGRDAGVVPGGRPSGARRPGEPLDLRPVDHRRLHGLGHHGRRCSRDWQLPCAPAARHEDRRPRRRA